MAHGQLSPLNCTDATAPFLIPMQTEPTEVKAARIKARKTAEDIFKYAQAESESILEPARAGFWTVLALRIAEHTGTVNDWKPADAKPPKPTMTIERAVIFEKGSLPFNSSQGKTPIGKIDLPFLHWCLKKHKEERKFFDDLEAYLNTTHVVNEEDETNDDDFHSDD